MAEIHLRPAGGLTITGSLASPGLISAAGGITASVSQRQFQFVKGSGGPVTVTANPQISAGVTIGQELYLRGCDNTNTVTINSGTGLFLNGLCKLKDGSLISLAWDGSVWVEVSRNDF